MLLELHIYEVVGDIKCTLDYKVALFWAVLILKHLKSYFATYIGSYTMNTRKKFARIIVCYLAYILSAYTTLTYYQV